VLVNFNVEHAQLPLSTGDVPQVEVPVIKEATVIFTTVTQRKKGYSKLNALDKNDIANTR
jgi:hypothetical protein